MGMKLIDMVNSYRQTTDLKTRLPLAGFIYCEIEPDLRLFIFGRVHPSATEDVLQEVLKAIFTNLDKFRGKTEKEFLGWCYRIARNKVNDQLRKQSADRTQPVPQEELWQFVDESGPLSPQDKMDLESAMNLLTESKPKCRDLLWKHFVIGLELKEMAKEFNLKSDAVRMKIKRCLDGAQGLMASLK